MKCSTCRLVTKSEQGKARCPIADCNIGEWDTAECCYTADEAGKQEEKNLSDYIRYVAMANITGRRTHDLAWLRVQLEKEENGNA